MDDKQAMHAMSIDDAYHVKRTLARGPSGVTELVSIDGNGPFVRKKIPSPLAQRNVWGCFGRSRRRTGSPWHSFFALNSMWRWCWATFARRTCLPI